MTYYAGKTQELIDSGVFLRPKYRIDDNIMTIKVADDYSFKMQIAVIPGEKDEMSISNDGRIATIYCTFGSKSQAIGNQYSDSFI